MRAGIVKCREQCQPGGMVTQPPAERLIPVRLRGLALIHLNIQPILCCRGVQAEVLRMAP